MKALITGASSGIGKALCHLLAKNGFSLIITARNELTLQTLAQELNVPVTILVADLKNPSDRQSLLSLIQQHTPDLIINCAGYGLYGDILSYSIEEQLSLFTVDATAAIEISIEAARQLKLNNKRGTILNVSSAAGFFPYPTFTLYAAAKAALSTFSQGFDEEVKPYGIRILTCCPGPVSTAFRDRASHGYPQKSDPLAISSEKAAELVYRQIIKQQPFKIIDWKTACLIRLTRLLPPRLLPKILKHTLSNRYRH